MTSDDAGLRAQPALTRARALKDRCYSAWHRDPAEVARCAEELARLAATETAQSGVATEIQALADWTAAVCAIGSGDLADAITLLDRAHEGFESSNLPADAAQSRIPKVMALALLGRFDEARDCAEYARDALLALGDIGSAARVVLNIGSLSYSQDRYAEAADHYRRAGVLFARIGDREHSVLADIGRGDACSLLGDLDEAEALYRRAATRASAHGLHVIASTASQALAEVALVRGRYREALSGLEAASRSFATLQMPLLRCQAERAMADAYLELNLLTEADALYAEVAAAQDPQSAITAWLWLQRARVAAMQGRDADSLRALRRSEDHFLKEANGVGLAEVRLARCAVEMKAGRWSEARALATDACQQLQALELPRDEAVLALAAAEVRAGDHAAALRRLDALIGDHATKLPVRERAWLWRGRALLANGDPAAARESFERAVEMAEAGLVVLPADDVQRSYLDARAGAYEEILRIELDEAATAPGDTGALRVLAALERLRARTYRFQLASSPHERLATHEDASALAEAREKLDLIYRRTHRLLREEADDPAPPGLDRERQVLESQLLDLQRRQRLAGSRLPGCSELEEIDWAAVRHGLPHTDAVVAYGRLDDEIFAVTSHGGALRLHRDLVDTDALARAMDALRQQLATQRLGAGRVARHGELLERRARQCLGRLYDQLWRPLVDAIEGAEAVRIIPSGSLGAVPFAALWDGRRYLVEHVAPSLTASLQSALDNRRVPRFTRVVLAADTVRLPGARDEIEGLAGIWSGSEVLMGAELDRNRLVSMARDADILHIACHGEFRSDNPLFSALILVDGRFTALEIEKLRLTRRPLVVLSACETGLSDPARGDEALGLVRSFLVAGASRVLAGLWQIDDASTAAWMNVLHRELRSACEAGTRPDRALSQTVAATQKRLIEAGVHPYHWAAFALHGGT